MHIEQVEIISITEAKSLNTHGLRPSCTGKNFTDKEADEFIEREKEWEKAEQEREVYSIVNLDEEKANGITIFRPFEPKIKYYSFGETVKAEVNREAKMCIIL